MKNFFRYWFPLILYAGLIFYLSSLSQPVIPGVPEFEFRDKVMHIGEYFVLSYLLLRLLRFYKIKKDYLYAIGIAFLYGVTDEIHQLFVPGRFFSFYDIIANGIGCLFVLVFKKRKLL